MPINYVIPTFPAPFISGIKPLKLSSEKPADVTIYGSYFTPDTIVTIAGSTINSTTFISDNEIKINVTVGNNQGLFDLIVDNGQQTIISNGIEIQENVWLDLRENGDVLTTGNENNRDVRVRNNMTVNRNANGMYFTGTNPWQSWVKWEKYSFERGNNTNVELIFKNYSSFMIGVGRNNNNENSNSQYYEAEVVLYFSATNYLWGLYGARTSQYSPQNLNANKLFKAKFTDDVTAGASWFLYEMPSSDPIDWDDESNLVISGVISNSFDLSGDTLMPFMIPRSNANNYVVALKVG